MWWFYLLIGWLFGIANTLTVFFIILFKEYKNDIEP